jgi:rubrerythrin
MDLGAILLLLALLLGIGLFLAAPLMRGASPRALDESPEVSSLLAERDRVINALQELDFDFKLGKIPERAYPELRTNLLQRGAQILRRLDELTPESRRTSETTSQAEERIERAAGGGSEMLADDRIESMLAARRAARRTKSAGFCPKCGKPVLVSDRFCPNCGRSLL